MWLRLFYVYERYQRKGSLIPYLIDSLKKNKKIELKEPFASRDFIYVDDVCKLILKFCDTSSNGIYNIELENILAHIRLLLPIEIY